MNLNWTKKRVNVIGLGLAIILIASACVPIQIETVSEEAPSGSISEAEEASSAVAEEEQTGATSESDEPKYGGVLKVGIQADVQSLDPHLASSYSSLLIIEQVYEGLLRFGPDMNIEPSLAESYEVKDPLTYEFKLRPGVKFHNGREVTSEDVKYSLDRIRDPDGGSPRGFWLEAVDSIETPDEQTVVIRLARPFAPLLSYLAEPGMAIVPQEVIEEEGDLAKTMVGTGPFKFVENIPNTRTVLEKNPEYWQGGRPYLDGLEYIPLPEDRSRTDNIVTGNVDFADQIPQKDIDILADNDTLRLEGGPGTLYDFLFFNQRRPPFDNVKVRQAIAYALDRQAMTDVVLFGHGRPITCGPIPPWNWAYADCNLYTEPDLDKARQLLDEAGYADGFSMVIKTGAPYKAQSDAAQMVKEAVAPLGIEVEVVPTEWGTYIDDILNTHDFDAGVIGLIGSNDPDDWLYAFFHTGEQYNFHAYSNARVDELLEEGRTTLDQDKRKAAYDEAQRILAEEAPIIPFFTYEQYEAVQDYVKGYQHMPNSSKLTFVDTWLDQ